MPFVWYLWNESLVYGSEEYVERDYGYVRAVSYTDSARLLWGMSGNLFTELIKAV